MSMKAVITGGAGFIGSHLVDGLLKEGATVLVLDDLSTGREENLAFARTFPSERFTLVRCDLVEKKAATELIRFKPDIVFHQAAQANVRKSVADPVFDGMVNVVGTVNMLEASKVCGVKRFIFASTGGAIYGEQEVFPAPEGHPVHPECPYGVSKRGAEEYLAYYGREHFITIALRYANVYGPRQNPKGEAGVVAIFAERLFAEEALLVNGDGMQTRDFVYVDDVVRANLLSAHNDLSSGFHIFNVGTGKETSVIDLLEALRAPWTELGNDGTIQYTHGPALPGEQKRSVIDASKIRKQFGWSPSVSLEEGLLRTVRSFAVLPA